MVRAGAATHYELAPAVAEPAGSKEQPSGEGFRIGDTDQVAEEIWVALEEIARPIRERGRISDTEKRDATVLDLCARTPLSLQQLAELLGRKKTYVKEVVQSLIDSGRLAHLYPEQPSHPKQKYRTATQAGEQDEESDSPPPADRGPL